MDIDLVYLWVNGNDPVWKAKHDAFTGTKPHNEAVDGKGRYVSHDELKYSLRSAEMYAPWIRRIFIVTDNQVPEWLNTANPKVQIVDHTEILPPEALPCFNSVVIEHHLHRIPGLSEHFLYANDDMFFNRPVTPADFFSKKDELPIIRFNRRPFRKFSLWYRQHVQHKSLSNYKRTIHNAALLVESRYGTYYSGKGHHNIDAYLKSTHAFTRQLFKKEIDATLANHVRADNDIQRNIYSYVALAEHKGHLDYVTQHTSFRLHIDNHQLYKKFMRYQPLLFCMNDSEYANDADREYAANFLSSYFRQKSSFELW